MLRSRVELRVVIKKPELAVNGRCCNGLVHLPCRQTSSQSHNCIVTTSVVQSSAFYMRRRGTMDSTSPMYLSKAMQPHFAQIYQAGLYAIFMRHDPAMAHPVPVQDVFDFHFENKAKQKFFAKWVRNDGDEVRDDVHLEYQLRDVT